MNFDYPMDRKSVEENINIEENFAWTLSWIDDRSLVFQPDDKLEIWQVYSFYILEDAKTFKWKKIRKNIKFQFEVSSSPSVVSSIPIAWAEQVPIDAGITLVFDRWVVPLGIVSSKKNPESWNVNISPDVKWRWRWLWTTTVKFTPEESFDVATKYHVSIPPWIEMSSGKKTVDDFSFDFITELPWLVSSHPRDKSMQVEPDDIIILNFNIPIDLISAKEKISMIYWLKGQKHWTWSISKIDISYWEIEKDWVKKLDKSILNIKPVKELAINSTQYELLVEKWIRALNWNLWSDKDYIISFETVWPFFVEEWRSHNAYSSFIRFSNPIKKWALKGKISIDPNIEWWDKMNFETSWWDWRYLNLDLNLQPSKTYTITIDQSLVDSWGQNLPSDYKLVVSTKAIDSKVFIHSDWEFGIFEKDMPPIYYLNWVNISSFDIKFAKTSLQEFLNIRNKV